MGLNSESAVRSASADRRLFPPLPEPSAIAEYAEAAEALGFTTIYANDHLLFSVPWLDGLIALAVAAGRTSRIRLMTTAALLAVRGAGPLGSALAALQHLSDGRLTAAVTPGSTRADYEAVEADFDTRWSRFDHEIPRLRELLDRVLADAAPPIWIASWGSKAGLRRVARFGDGWLGSASRDARAHLRLQDVLARQAGGRREGSSSVPAGAGDHVPLHQ